MSVMTLHGTRSAPTSGVPADFGVFLRDVTLTGGAVP